MLLIQYTKNKKTPGLPPRRLGPPPKDKYCYRLVADDKQQLAYSSARHQAAQPARDAVLFSLPPGSSSVHKLR